MKRTELMNFAQSLVSSLEEVADKVASIESIISGNDDCCNEEQDTTDYVEEPEDDYTEEPMDEGEEPVEESEGEDEPVEEDGGEEPVATEFSEKHYQKVKDFLAL